jgi:hypothetical protein
MITCLMTLPLATTGLVVVAPLGVALDPAPGGGVVGIAGVAAGSGERVATPAGGVGELGAPEVEPGVATEPGAEP